MCSSIRLFIMLSIFMGFELLAQAQGTRLLRQPTISADHVAFIYGGDLWITTLDGGRAIRLTSTAAVESNPHFSPDGKKIAFSSNRSGTSAVYILPLEGGTPERLTWYPQTSEVKGWTPDGNNILYSTYRETAPVGHARLWTVPASGGPSTLLPIPRGYRADFGPDNQMVIEPISRWDSEWRAYRGGQNTSLIIQNMEDLSETFIPNNRSTDIFPIWLNNKIYFLSDRDWTANIWIFDPKTKNLEQLTEFEGADIKYLAANQDKLIYEREGYLHLFDPSTRQTTTLDITVIGDYPWAETRLENVSDQVRYASISPNGKRAVMEARGEIFTIPAEDGSTRNLTRSSHAADRAPIWSPKGDKVAWFSDESGQYKLMLTDQDGLSPSSSIEIGESKMAWEPTWSPDGKYIAFVDDKVRIRLINIEKKSIETIDIGAVNLERGSMGPTWSPDSKWLAYARTGSNNFRRITLYSLDKKEKKTLTDPMADAFSPAWDKEGRYLYFLASTDVALGSGWANTSAIQAKPTHGAYIVLLRKEDTTPFPLKSDEESVEKESETDVVEEEKAKGSDKKSKENKKEDSDGEDKKKDTVSVQIDWEGIERRVIAMPIPVRRYTNLMAGTKGTVFIGERVDNQPGLVLHKFTIEDKKNEEFAKGVSDVSLSESAEKMLLKMGGKWKIVPTAKSPSGSDGNLSVDLRMELDRPAEWKQMFEEAWRYERDYFYDPGIHGRDWDEVYERYAPLVPYIKHRSDLTYILDQVNGELSVGHSFVFGGDFPAVDTSRVGLLGANLVSENGHWKIERIFTSESWNPDLVAPLDQPGLGVEEGMYILAVNGIELSGDKDPFQYFDGTADRLTTLHVSEMTNLKTAKTVVVKPIRNEYGLRQRAWVEDNRRKVDELSDGKLAYVWVPNTSTPGFVSFNRYFFAQQDKAGAVIDERFNGGGFLDDYMVDLMTRKLRAAITNEAPNGKHIQLPAGILGPKVLLINELAGSGGDFFPWIFRQQNAGPLIGTTTWGGLVKSSVHYPLVDGGALTSPDNAVFDPINNEWIGENVGIAPDIEVRQDAKATAAGRDVQLERGVQEVLKLLEEEGELEIVPPPFPTPAVKPKN